MTQDAKTREFYNKYGEREWERLEKSAYDRLNFLIHMDFMMDGLADSGEFLLLRGRKPKFPTMTTKSFTMDNFKAFFGNDYLVTKAISMASERREALVNNGWEFIDTHRDHHDYYRIKLINEIQPIVLIVTGPCGSGKTTISDLIVQNSNFIRISGDEIKEEFFPEIENITDDPEALEKVYIEIFKRAKMNFENGMNSVIDYVILGQKRIEEYKKTFAKNLEFKVLLARKEIIIERDQLRDCWTSGEECVVSLYDSYNNLKDYIGAKNYIDNSKETPEETYLKHFAHMVRF